MGEYQSKAEYGRSDERTLVETEGEGGQSVDLDLAGSDASPAEPEPEHDGYDTQDLDALFDWLQELGDEETIALFELLGGIDPLESELVDGVRTFKYSEAQRKLLGEAASTFKSAGFDSK